MPKATPGPWQAVFEREQWWVRDSTGFLSISLIGRKELEANARLIAACPSMYDYIKGRAEEGDLNAAKIITAIEGSTQ